MKKEVKILGTTYLIEKKKYNEQPKFEKRNIDGYCDQMLKKMVHCDMTTYPGFENQSQRYCDACEKETLRHEIIHAFLGESGLMQSSAQFLNGWSENEEMVDWIAIQSPKIFEVFQELDIL